MEQPGGRLRLMAVLAHPDDESLGVGGVLARYASEGVETFVVTATRGERGRYRDGSTHPGPEALGRIREAELRAACAELGVREVRLLGYMDGNLDRADPKEAIGRIAAELRRVRPDVVLTFGPDGAYGHPDHIAICQFTMAGVVRAAQPWGESPEPAGAGAPHMVSKVYWLAWPAQKWAAYQSAFKKLVSRVDGVEREAQAWPDWALTSFVDTAAWWRQVWRAVQCHESQMAVYSRLAELPEEHHRGLWGCQEFYRVMSLVNGGRDREEDLFAGLR